MLASKEQGRSALKIMKDRDFRIFKIRIVLDRIKLIKLKGGFWK